MTQGWRTTVVVLGAGFVLFVSGVPVAPPGVPSPLEGRGFDTTRALGRLERIVGQHAHPTDSLANDGVRERLIAELRALGLTAVVRDQFVCNSNRRSGATCGRVRNVLAQLGPPGRGAVMVASHYDSVGAALAR
jgi:acetylornithine deacetylase/succinyl-diaminopimelate desuccinylase-like protein